MSGRQSEGPPSWSRPAHIADRVRRAWLRGELLRAYAAGTDFPSIEVPLRRPTSADLAEHLEEARRWAAEIEHAAEAARRFCVIMGNVGGKSLGKSRIPVRARVESYAQAWRLLGVNDEVARFDQVLQLSAETPTAWDWAYAHPLRAVSLAEEWPALLAARDWLDRNRESGLYLRQINVPGVDTKFVEHHRTVLAEILDVPKSSADFLSALGLAGKPGLIRMRFDPALLGLPPHITEATFRLDQLGRLGIRASHVLIVENEISFLSVPVPERGVVLWGRGYDAGSPASLEWLGEIATRGEVRYWGDIDTHGFAILNRVRTHLPEVRSVLMDHETLLAHEPRWVREPAPTNVALTHLTDAESALYAAIVTDRFAPALRLEQERIDWAWAARAFREE